MALRIQHSTLDDQCLVERHWESQLDILRFVDRATQCQLLPSRERIFFPSWHQVGSHGQKNPRPDYGLHTILDRLDGIIDPECQEAIDTVGRIVRAIGDRILLPPALDIHRRRTMGRAGYAVNIHKVNRGQLSTAWKRIYREQLPDSTGVITLVLCTDYTANATYPAAQYTTAATLALAQKIEETGRQCEIWASILTRDAHRMRTSIVPEHPAAFHELDHIVVKRPGESISAPGLAALCSLSYLRRLFFQVWTMLEPTIGAMGNFGKATNKRQVYQALSAYIARQGIPQESVLMGADETDHIEALPGAVTWVQRQIDTLKVQAAS